MGDTLKAYKPKLYLWEIGSPMTSGSGKGDSALTGIPLTEDRPFTHVETVETFSPNFQQTIEHETRSQIAREGKRVSAFDPQMWG